MNTRKTYYTTLIAGQALFAIVYFIPLWRETVNARLMNTTLFVTLTVVPARSCFYGRSDR